MKTILSVVVLGLASTFAFAADGPAVGCGMDCSSAACMAACKNMSCCANGCAAANVQQPQRIEPSRKVDTSTKPAVQARQRMEK